MWDSSGKIPSGMMQAHFHDLGNYNECFDVPKIGPYQVQYCLIQITKFLPLQKLENYNLVRHLRSLFLRFNNNFKIPFYLNVSFTKICMLNLIKF